MGSGHWTLLSVHTLTTLTTMLRLIFIAAAAACALGQLGNMVIDSIHGYRVEYDDRHDIVMMVNDRNCYIVEAEDSAWDAIVRDESDLHTATEQIYQQIQAGTGITSMTHTEASNAYHSTIERWQGIKKRVHKVA